MTAVENKRVRCWWRNADDVACRDFLPYAALNCAVSFLMGSHRFSIHQGAPHDECCGSGLHNHHVYLGLVDFGRSVSFPMNKQKGLAGIIGKLLHGKMMR